MLCWRGGAVGVSGGMARCVLLPKSVRGSFLFGLMVFPSMVPSGRMLGLLN